MISGEVLYQKTYEFPRSPRKVVLKLAWNEGRTDSTSIEERASNAHSIKYGETCRGEIDHRIQGLPHSTVEQEDHTRKEIVKKVDSSIQKSTQIEEGTWSTSKCVRCLLKLSASVFDILDDRDLALYMRNLLVSHREDAKIEPGSI